MLVSTAFPAVLTSSCIARKVGARDGTGLAMTGGQKSYGPGGYFKSPLERVLPVSMEMRREHRKMSVAVVVAGFIYVRRDLAGLWVAVAGVLTGIVAAFVSAPSSAIAFGGVTGGGTDLLVAALRQGGSDVIHASLGQGLFSDPIDKTITSFVVFIILSGLSPRLLARFPLGERLTRNRAD